MMWTEKHRPSTLKEIIGHDKSLLELKEYTLKNKSILLYGETGVGKTCAVYALADNLGYEILEINASDFRGKKEIEDIVGNAAVQQSLIKEGKIILVDDIDGLSGKKDRGGIQALLRVIKQSKFPVILTANDPWNLKLNAIRRCCKLIEFKNLNHLVIFNGLKKILKREKKFYDEGLLKELAIRSNGDFRGAINDLQALIEGKTKLESIEAVGERAKKEKIIGMLNLILKEKNVHAILSKFNHSDLDLNEFFLWVDENLPKEYTSKTDLAKAYDCLSRADVFDGRIKRWQYWRFLVYKIALMTMGVALAKEKINTRFVDYKRSTRILKMWIAKQRNSKKVSISRKLSKKLHLSVKKISNDVFPFLKIFVRKGIKLEGLDEEDVNYLMGHPIYTSDFRKA